MQSLNDPSSGSGQPLPRQDATNTDTSHTHTSHTAPQPQPQRTLMSPGFTSAACASFSANLAASHLHTIETSKRVEGVTDRPISPTAKHVSSPTYDSGSVVLQPGHHQGTERSGSTPHMSARPSHTAMHAPTPPSRRSTRGGSARSTPPHTVGGGSLASTPRGAAGAVQGGGGTVPGTPGSRTDGGRVPSGTSRKGSEEVNTRTHTHTGRVRHCIHLGVMSCT